MNRRIFDFRPLACGHWVRTVALAAACATAPYATVAKADVVHDVVRGETLSGIALRYTGSATDWSRLQALNRIANPHHLKPRSQVRIPAALLFATPTPATVMALAGEVLVLRPTDVQPQPPHPDMALPEGTHLTLGANGFVHLKLGDGSLVGLSPGARAQLTRMRQNTASGLSQMQIKMDAGRAESLVQPDRNPASRFEIHTPQAVASVRGTRFGVSVDDSGALSDVSEGRVEIQTPGQLRGGRHRVLSAGEGARVDSTGALQVVDLLPKPDTPVWPDAVTSPDRVELALPDMPGAAGFRVRLARDPAMTALLREVVVARGPAALAAVEDGDYTVGIQALDALGLPGAELRLPLRVNAHPQPPLFQRPAQDQRLETSQIELACTRPEHVSHFHIQLATDPSFTQLVKDADLLQECQLAVELPPGHYHWRVASVDAQPSQTKDRGPFSATRSFEVVRPTSKVPSLTSQGENGRLQLHWGGDAASQYQVQVAHDADFNPPLFDTWVDGNTYSLDTVGPGTYFVRIRARHKHQAPSAWTSVQEVRIAPIWRTSNGTPVQTHGPGALRRTR